MCRCWPETAFEWKSSVEEKHVTILCAHMDHSYHHYSTQHRDEPCRYDSSRCITFPPGDSIYTAICLWWLFWQQLWYSAVALLFWHTKQNYRLHYTTQRNKLTLDSKHAKSHISLTSQNSFSHSRRCHSLQSFRVSSCSKHNDSIQEKHCKFTKLAWKALTTWK